MSTTPWSVAIEEHGDELVLRFRAGVQSFELGRGERDDDSRNHLEFVRSMFVVALDALGAPPPTETPPDAP